MATAADAHGAIHCSSRLRDRTASTNQTDATPSHGFGVASFCGGRTHVIHVVSSVVP